MSALCLMTEQNTEMTVFKHDWRGKACFAAYMPRVQWRHLRCTKIALIDITAAYKSRVQRSMFTDPSRRK
jgi:hypothetical protein